MSGFLAVLIVALVIAGIVTVLVGRDRYKPPVNTEFTMPTTEVHVDPVTGVRQRVFVNPATGERAFVDEPIMHPAQLPPLERPGLYVQQPAPPPALPPGASEDPSGHPAGGG